MKEQLLEAIPQVPAEFSIEDLEAILNQPQPSKSIDSVVFPERPANITPEEAADWDRYTSPEAMALYTKFAIPTEIASLHGIAANLQSTY